MFLKYKHIKFFKYLGLFFFATGVFYLHMATKFYIVVYLDAKQQEK